MSCAIEIRVYESELCTTISSWRSRCLSWRSKDSKAKQSRLRRDHDAAAYLKLAAIANFSTGKLRVAVLEVEVTKFKRLLDVFKGKCERKSRETSELVVVV